MTTVTIDSIAELRDSQRAAGDDYSALVLTVAAGNAERPPLPEIQATLAAAGRTIDDLERDAAALAQRFRDHETAAELDALTAEREGLLGEIRAADKRLTEAKRLHAEAVGKLDARLMRLGDRITDAKAARRRLVNTAPAELRAAVSEAQAAVGELVRARATAVERMARARADVARYGEAARRTIRFPGERSAPEAEAAQRAQTEAAEALAEIERLDAAIPEARRAIAEAEAGLLEIG